MRVLHIITDLYQGGAENVLYRLVTHNSNSTESIIISLIDLGVYGEPLRENGIKVYTINMNRGKLSLSGIIKLWKLIRLVNPDVVQTWMYHADLIGGIVSKLAGCKVVFWGVVNFNLDPSAIGSSTRWVAKACAIISRIIPNKIISCSSRAVISHQAIGYAPSKFVVIPLGFDLKQYYRDELAGVSLRDSWGIPKNAIVLGCVARWDLQKDHKNLLTAFAMLKKQFNNVYCILVGPGMDSGNDKLVELIKETNGNENNIRLVGRVDSIPKVMSSFDIHVLPSLGEAFPNVVAEAMACETPCVVTDVGDAALIVKNLGWVVPPNSPKELSLAIITALNEMNNLESWKRRMQSCHMNIVENYSIDRMVEQYKTTWQSIFVKKMFNR